MRTSLAFAAAGLLLIAAPALADGRENRLVRDGSGPASAAVTPPSLPSQAPGVSASHNGSINSYNSVSTNSGGNSGSNVTTGDQSSSVTVINIGSGNSASTVVTGEPAQRPDSQCAGRGCPRTR